MMQHAWYDDGGRRKRNECNTIVCVLVVLLCFIMGSWVKAQEFNPPYPRFGIFTFSGNTEACVEILKDFDLIAYPPGNGLAAQYKEQNPDVILLGTSGCLIAWDMTGLPEEWYYHDKDGNRMPLWEGSYFMNFTPLCPEVDIGDGHGPKNFIDHCIHDVQAKIDFTYYDGVFHDWWWGGPSWDIVSRGDLNSNGIADNEEWGADSVRALWRDGLLEFHEREYQIPGLDYVVVQIGMRELLPNVNGCNFEDWPIYNGPWITFHYQWCDDGIQTKDPKLVIFNSALSHYHLYYPVEPYKNNYRSVRFGLASCLLTPYLFYVDEGNQIGHHGNVHFYDEFEAKGQLGYTRTERIQLEGKAKAPISFAMGVFVRFFDNGVSVVNASGMEQTITASELAALDPVSGSNYYRFLGGQDPEFNNGQEVTDTNPLVLWGDTHMANWTEPEVFGDGAMLFRAPKTLITPIVVDNHVNNQTSPGSDPVQYTGAWVLDSDGKKFYAVYTARNYGPFQPDGFAWSAPGSGENTATYVPTVGIAGMYEVFEWHGYRGSSAGDYDLSSDVPVIVSYGGGSDTTFTIDQTENFGQWNSLGVYFFATGTGGNVRLTNQAGGIVISDAMKFVYRGPAGEYDSEAPAPPQGVQVIRRE